VVHMPDNGQGNRQNKSAAAVIAAPEARQARRYSSKPHHSHSKPSLKRSKSRRP
jgi:hypothetical protein